MTRACSALPKRKRSATTSSNLCGPVGVATSRSACTRVKPLALSHCVTSSAVVLAGNSTGKVMTMRGSCARAAVVTVIATNTPQMQRWAILTALLTRALRRTQHALLYRCQCTREIHVRQRWPPLPGINPEQHTENFSE